MEFTTVIANLGKHAAGIVAETPLSFPTTTEQVQAALRAIGVDGVRYEEVIVKDYSIGIDGIAPLLGEYAHIDELNYLACRLERLPRRNGQNLLPLSGTETTATAYRI